MIGLWRRLRLRAQILITLTALLFVSLLVIFFVVRGLNRSELLRERRVGAIEMAAVAASLAPAAARTQPEREAFVRSLAERSPIRAALLVDADLAVLAPRGMRPFWSPDDETTLRRMLAGGDPAYRYPRGTDAAPLWVLTPVPPAREPRGDDALAPIAGLALYYDFGAPVSRRLLGEQVLLLFLALIIGLLALVAHMALTRLVVRPVRGLIRTVDRVAVDDLRAIRMPEGRRGSELGVLSRAVDDMLERLKDNKARIDHSMERLRQMNARLVRAQESLVRSEKLASVGQLAAGVAHEIGNPISIVLGYLEMLRQGDVPEERRQEYLADIQEATDRINQIIRDLLDFARPVKEESAEAVLPRVIENSVKLLRPQKKFKGVEVDIAYLGPDGAPTDERPTAYMNEGRLQQVLVNLLINAADAMEGRGCITLRVRDRGQRVRIEVADEGPGVPRRQRRRIFDPFYTTKEPGEGTGLGLAICYSLVAAFDGEIALGEVVESAERGDEAERVEEAERGDPLAPDDPPARDEADETAASDPAPRRGATFVVDLWKAEHAPPDAARNGERPSLLDTLDVSLDDEDGVGPIGPAPSDDPLHEPTDARREEPT